VSYLYFLGFIFPLMIIFTSYLKIIKAIRQVRPQSIQSARLSSTGRQPPPLSSVLYRIIYKRCSVVATQVLLREKSGA